MADVGTVIAIIQIADRVIELTRYWIEAVRDAPSDLRSILLETSLLRTIFETIRFLSNCNETSSEALVSLSQPDGPVEHCGKVLRELVGLLPAEHIYTKSGSRSKKERSQATLARLAWPLKQAKARKLLQDLERFKTGISLALTTDSVNDVKDIKMKATKTLHMLTESQRLKVYEWLEQTDPSPIHNRAQQQLEEGTCDWILRSPEWADWLAAKHRCLWIHGIPGTGKTVLASYLAEKVKVHYIDVSESKRAIIYYYCYFGHNQDEAVPLLRWMATQLCRQARSVPVYTYNLFEQGCEPSLSELLNSLAICLDPFDTVYVIIDALDESKPRDNLLKVVRDLATDPRFAKVQLLATSREYIDIERVIEPISMPVSMSNSSVAEDIRRHVRSTLQSNPKFARWPQNLLAEVEMAVSSRAQGMFRWAVCQIDRLRRLKCEPSIVRNALATLPMTLDETYERIFLEIPEEERFLVRQCLNWIDFHNEQYNDGIPCALLLQALEKCTASSCDAETGHYFDEHSIREICGCLVQVSAGSGFEDAFHNQKRSIVSFAHYTVREFLCSDRISTSPAAYFGLGRQSQLDTLRFVLDNALDFRPSDFTQLKPNDGGIIESLISHLTSYCAVSGILAISNKADQIASQPELTNCVFKPLDMSATRLQPIVDFVTDIEDSDHFLSIYNVDNSSADLWTLEWNTEPTPMRRHAMTLLMILVLSPKTMQLATKYLEKVGETMDLVHVPLQFTIWVDEGGSGRVCEFNGPMIEFFAQLPHTVDYVRFKNILDTGCELPDPTALLYSYLSAHEHAREVDDGNDCLLQRVLELGADYNGCGYAITPLQIAVDRLDYDGTRILLGTGADPNGLGDLSGNRWRGLRWHRLKSTGASDDRDDYRDLIGTSPLFILRSQPIRYQPKNKRQMCEELLLQSGAESFTSNRQPKWQRTRKQGPRKGGERDREESSDSK